MTALPTPIQPESFSVPRDHGFRFDESPGQIASHSTGVTARSKGVGRQHSDGVCDLGWLSEGQKADVEEQEFPPGARLDSENLAESKKATRE
jgi:hypothetical protein